MTMKERRRIILKTIRRLEDKMSSLKYCEYDGMKPLLERESELDTLRDHWNLARSVLVLLDEEELEGAA